MKVLVTITLLNYTLIVLVMTFTIAKLIILFHIPNINFPNHLIKKNTLVFIMFFDIHCFIEIIIFKFVKVYQIYLHGIIINFLINPSNSYV